MKNEKFDCKFLRKFLQIVMEDDSHDRELEAFNEDNYLADHVTHCQECRAYYDSEKSVIEIVQKNTYKIPIPSDLVDVIQSKITQEVV